MTKKGRNLKDGEISLWQKMVRGMTPWHDTPAPHVQSPPPKCPKKQANTANTPHFAAPSAPITPQNFPQTLDRRTDDKLRRGKMPIEAVLDLHGMTQEQAHMALDRFVMASYQAGKRCVLVITGKGSRDAHDDGYVVSERREKGVLRARLPDWLAMKPLSEIVLKHVPAARGHGGDGAFYIYLKNNKK